MSERERHSKRRSRQEDVPDLDDRYDPGQGAKRFRRGDASPDLGQSLTGHAVAKAGPKQPKFTLFCPAGPPRKPIRGDLDFSDR